jgi:diguanylate cyclase (GGDEF)-like protein
MLDLDGFKGWNDRHGHVAGDGALARAARVIAAGTRVSDTAGRYGGDEFALVLPETPLAGAIAVAEKVRAAIEAERPEGDPFTLSSGVACAPEDGRSAAELVRAADTRLYAAKAAGGNRVVAADG